MVGSRISCPGHILGVTVQRTNPGHGWALTALPLLLLEKERGEQIVERRKSSTYRVHVGHLDSFEARQGARHDEHIVRVGSLDQLQVPLVRPGVSCLAELQAGLVPSLKPVGEDEVSHSDAGGLHG